VDRHVSPRLTYWTGVWEPSREAVSREVVALRAVGRTRAVVSFSRGQRSALSLRSRVIRLSGARWGALRALAQIVERTGDVTHMFGALDAWHFLRCLGRRPLVFTVAIEGSGGLLPDRRLYDRVRVFVAESEALREALVAGGIPPARIRLVHPGVDLEAFAPRPAPAGRFRLLFASTPSDPAEFEARGIPLLVELARALPSIDVICAWRQWGDTAGANRALAALAPPLNFRVEPGDCRDMAGLYARAHATACLFAPGAGKSAPNSIIEGLACGRPALVSHSCGISRLLARRGAGVAAPRCLRDLVDGVRTLQSEYAAYAGRARALAEAAFALDGFRRAYAGIYDALSQQQN
jgi:glycosyltransferase involved in cell wall biosynthesis